MSLNILSVLPDVNASGVILQGAVIVTFDQAIDVTTYDESSFLLSAPPEGPVVPPGGLVGSVAPVSGTDYVAGTFSFAQNTAGATIATFVPARPMRPNVKYTVLISTAVATAAGVTLANNYTWSFVTGVLNLTTPPPQQPGPAAVGRIRKEEPPDLTAVIDQQRPAPDHHRVPAQHRSCNRRHPVRHLYPHLTR